MEGKRRIKIENEVLRDTEILKANKGKEQKKEISKVRKNKLKSGISSKAYMKIQDERKNTKERIKHYETLRNWRHGR